MNTNNGYDKWSAWMNSCALIALRDEWCIDADWPEWRFMFDAGKTPGEAVNILFEEISSGVP